MWETEHTKMREHLFSKVIRNVLLKGNLRFKVNIPKYTFKKWDTFSNIYTEKMTSEPRDCTCWRLIPYCWKCVLTKLPNRLDPLLAWHLGVLSHLLVQCQTQAKSRRDMGDSNKSSVRKEIFASQSFFKKKKKKETTVNHTSSLQPYFYLTL